MLLLVIAASVAIPALATAASTLATRLAVKPADGSPSTRFVVSFRNPTRTGRYRHIERHDVLSVSGPAGSTGCVTAVDQQAPDARKGARVRITLDPSDHGGSWCAGTYHGTVEEVQSPRCAAHQACPALVLVEGTLGRFTFRVATPPGGSDTTPPVFAGLKTAFACTPGAQRPGETTPFTLTWDAATDDVTPANQIVYDVYESSTAGGEDFSHPTWTTAPGVTTFKTPGLPSHGTFYFVVRARDQAGNEDQNRVELLGSDPCV
jgi:hypothetical protein